MNEVIATAKARRTGEDGVTVLSTGVRVRLHPVAPGLLADATGRVKFPKPPMWLNPDKDREEPNYNDPDYLDAVAEARARVGNVTLDTLVLFGLELADGLPEDDGWLSKLRFLAKRGALDLGEYDLDDPLEREFLYKRYVAVGRQDAALVSRLSGLTEEEVDAAAESFPGTA